MGAGKGMFRIEKFQDNFPHLPDIQELTCPDGTVSGRRVKDFLP